jgi:hypothetical protein
MSTNSYVADDYWVDGYAVDEPVANAAPTPTTVQTVLPAYLYWQYQDDSDLQAFVAAFNNLAQQYVNTFNALNLPVYTSDSITGDLLNWVAKGIYGMDRPVLSSGNTNTVGPYNTTPYNVVVYNDEKVLGQVISISTTDDVFKRILTWNLYRGDGKIFNVLWLKRRVKRFLEGLNGTDPGVTSTYDISVTFASGNVIHIDVTAWSAANPSSPMPATLQAAINTGACMLPFQYIFNVVI